jgi:predicted RNA binding protein YcfA (HicA-like mRNA interferase family)
MTAIHLELVVDNTTCMLHHEVMKARELIGLLKEQGWVLDRIRGSHHQFKHPKAVRTLTVPVHGKEIPERLARLILKQAERAVQKEV